MIYNRLLAISDVADYLQMSDDFVEREIHLDNLDAIYIGDDWRIETRRTLSRLFSKRRTRAVESAGRVLRSTARNAHPYCWI
jgi:hypothetical protein